MPDIIDLKTGKTVSVEDSQPQEISAQSISNDIIDLGTGDIIQSNPELNTPTDTVSFDERQKIERDFAAHDLATSKNPIEAALISSGKTVVDLGRFLGFGGEESEIEKQALKVLAERNPVSTGVGQTVPFLVPGAGVANIATLPARATAAGALGALEGATIASGTDQDVVTGAASGAAIGTGLELAFPKLAKIGGAVFKKITGKNPSTPLVRKNGKPTSELSEALDSAGLTFDDLKTINANELPEDLIEDSLARKEFLEENDLIPTRAQVTGDATDFQLQQELGKKSGKVRNILESQQSTIFDKFENQISSTGGSANPSNSPVFDFIGDNAIKVDSEIHDAYKTAKEIAGDNKIVDVRPLVRLINSRKSKDTLTKGFITASKGTALDSLERDSKGKIIDTFISPKQAEELRASFNVDFDSLNPAAKRQLHDFKESLDDLVAKDVGEDIFKEARAAKAKFEQDLSKAKINKFDLNKKELVRDILNNKIAPEDVLEKAVFAKGTKRADLDNLKTYLHIDENPAGIQAWNDLRAEAMDKIKDDAFTVIQGQPQVTKAGLDRVLKRVGRDKLGVLFNKEELKFLNDMSKVLRIIEPARGTAIGKGPSAQAIQALGQSLQRVPFLKDTFEGLDEVLLNASATSLPELQKSITKNFLQSGTTAGAIAADAQEDEGITISRSAIEEQRRARGQ